MTFKDNNVISKNYGDQTEINNETKLLYPNKNKQRGILESDAFLLNRRKNRPMTARN